MAWDVNFINWITISAGWNALLNSLLWEIINQSNFMTDVNSLQSDLCLAETKALSQNELFSQIVWARELDTITELWLKPELERAKTPDKWFKIKQYWGQITVSYLMSEWIRQSKTLDWANEDVKRGWMDFMQNGKFLVDWSKLNIAIDAIRLLEKWFSVTASNWAWSATPKWQPLFSTAHTVKNWTLTFRNVLTTPNQVLSANSLQDALTIHKWNLRWDNGLRANPPKWAFKLWVSKIWAVTARSILNTKGNQAGIFSWTWNNANQLNTFNFDWNMVEIKEIPLLWDYDKNNNLIGSDTMWYVVNEDNLRQAKWFRMIRLYDPVVQNYYYNPTNAYVTDINLAYAMDHYWAEVAIVWSLWTV